MVTFFENLGRQRILEKKAWGNSYDYRLNQYANFDEGLGTEGSLAQVRRERRGLPTRFNLEITKHHSLFSLHKVSMDIIKFNKVKRFVERQNWTVTANVLVRSWSSRSLFDLLERDRNGRKNVVMLF
jgi:hypothetical protein